MSILRAGGIIKDCPGAGVLDNVTVSFDSGKVHASIGKNGPRKSTLVKVFAGAIQPANGHFYPDERELHFSIPVEALDKGTVIVHQEPSLAPHLSAAENISLGRLPKKGRLIDWRRTYQMTGELLYAMGVDTDLHEKMFRLSMWQCQVVEVTKAMSFKPKVPMLDEPTSTLATNEAQRLFEAIRILKEQDVIIIYTSRRLQGLWEVADSVTVLRDGEYIGAEPISSLQHKDIITMVFGSAEIKERPGNLKVRDDIIMDVRHLTREGKLQDISLQLREREVLGIVGMLRPDRTEPLHCIFDADPYDSGEILVDQKTAPKNAGPIGMMQMGLGLTPEERKMQGVILIYSICDNLCYASTDKMTQRHVINEETRKEFSERQIRGLQIKIPDLMAPISSLSGGNRRRVIIGNWSNTAPKIMMYNEPSRGIDVKIK